LNIGVFIGFAAENSIENICYWWDDCNTQLLNGYLL